MNWVPLDADIDEQQMLELSGRYHYGEAGRSALIKCYRKIKPLVHAAVCYRILKVQDCDYQQIWKAVAVITLGSAVDRYQYMCEQRDQIEEAFMIDCLSMELLSRAYISFDRLLHQETGLWPGEYLYPGSDGPLQMMEEIMRLLGQKQVKYNSAYVLQPARSVAFTVSLYDGHRKKHSDCRNCKNTDCVYRNEENEKAEDKVTELAEQNSCGCIHMYMGDGKGKTTAAIGLAIRAAGAGKKVVFVQFMKGQDTSEISVMEKIPQIRVIRNEENLGWLNLKDEEQRQRFTQLHNASLDQVRQLMAERQCDVLILDEVTYPYMYDLIDRKALQELILHRPQQMEIVLTGRDPDPFFLEQADYITDMKCVRHPYQKGIQARKGIEF
ncbi:MAG: cob(I)yrinic acid a,c-diamide adenosyltransferase [Butyrivibrio sp.]|jgi:cob(I)alamin adenosyltransferase|nr:cob(I)yrinic acid a,c-diamide adenosyltransferase [Butyrivibrio sp.]